MYPPLLLKRSRRTRAWASRSTPRSVRADVYCMSCTSSFSPLRSRTYAFTTYSIRRLPSLYRCVGRHGQPTKSMRAPCTPRVRTDGSGPG
jgi:hypothetical protein